MPTPIAVLISDIHFTVPTLELASSALLLAQREATKLNVPLIIAGDTLDTKAVMRAECVNTLIVQFTQKNAPRTFIAVGNHDLCNEKGQAHSLNFLSYVPNVQVVDFYQRIPFLNLAIIPYQSDKEKLKQILANPKTPKTLIMHQGVMGAKMGHYIQDTTSLPPEAFDGFRVISGHYHARQDIKCGKTGLFSYIGNPYTLNFGEANDPEKGFQILNDDGSLTFVPTKLSRHVIINLTTDDLKHKYLAGVLPSDKIWLKLQGPKTELAKINKQDLGIKLFNHSNYKLDLIPLELENQVKQEVKKDMTNGELLDTLIDATPESSIVKDRLKELWRTLAAN